MEWLPLVFGCSSSAHFGLILLAMRGISVCLLFAGLSQAVQVYLSPSPNVPSSLSPSHASFALSRHLGLEFFELAGDGIHEDILNEPSFVGQGSKSALLLSVDENDARGMCCSALQH